MITDLTSTHGTFLNGTKLDPEIPHPVKTGDTITLGTALDSASGGAHLPTKLEITISRPPRFPSPPPTQQTSQITSHGPQQLPARNSFHAPSDSEEEYVVAELKTVLEGATPAAAAVVKRREPLRPWRPFPPIKVPDMTPLPAFIDLTSENGAVVWEPAPVIEIESDAEEENKKDEGEVYYSRPVPAGEFAEFNWGQTDDDDEEDEETEEDADADVDVDGSLDVNVDVDDDVEGIVRVVPETQMPDQPRPLIVIDPEPSIIPLIKVRFPPHLYHYFPQISLSIAVSGVLNSGVLTYCRLSPK
jgi:hypothetical protein